MLCNIFTSILGYNITQETCVGHGHTHCQAFGCARYDICDESHCAEHCYSLDCLIHGHDERLVQHDHVEYYVPRIYIEPTFRVQPMIQIIGRVERSPLLDHLLPSYGPYLQPSRPTIQITSTGVPHFLNQRREQNSRLSRGEIRRRNALPNVSRRRLVWRQ